jgi:glycosyltransferase involved in cell wall biosynthesis
MKILNAGWGEFMPQISIIVPVYKAEKTLCRCVDSLLAQSFSDTEIILVNDGSPDGSLEICNRYAAQNPAKIKVVNQQNEGVSSARNAGISAAGGKYIMFCDSDDYVSNDWCKVHFEQAEKEPNAWVVSGYNCVFDDSAKNTELVVNGAGVTVAPLEDYYKALEAGISSNPVNKIFRSDIMSENSICFPPKMQLGEDVIFTCAYLSCCSQIVFIHASHYFQMCAQGSLSRRFFKNLFEDNLKAHMARKPFISEAGRQIYFRRFFYNCLTMLDRTMSAENLSAKQEKIESCNKILKNAEFLEAIEKGQPCENAKFLKLLKKGNYKKVLRFKKIHALVAKLLKRG